MTLEEQIWQNLSKSLDSGKTYYDIFVNTCQICIWFKADTPEKLQKLAQLMRLTDKDLLYFLICIPL